MIIGSNASDFPAFQQAVPAAAMRRGYYPEENTWPKRWPVNTTSAALISIRPNPNDLLRGKLDAQVKSLVESAPPGSCLNAWHEAGNLAEYNHLGYIRPHIMNAVHARMQRLCAGTSARYGPILCMPPAAMGEWMPRGMDWYGLDIYDWPQFRLPDGETDAHGRLSERLSGWLGAVRLASGQKYPKLSICETNSNRLGHRAEWFTALGGWLQSYPGGEHFLTFWSEAGCGPWLPEDAKTIAALNRLAK